MIQRLKFRGKALARINIPNEHHTKIVKEMKVGEFTTTDDLIGAENTVHPSLEGDRLTLFFELVARGGIDPSTVGQWTGLKDSKGVEIWEGDILSVTDPNDEKVEDCIVEYQQSSSSFPIEVSTDDFDVTTLGWAKSFGFVLTVIGTIHDKEQA